jgi:hypothetical protein
MENQHENQPSTGTPGRRRRAGLATLAASLLLAVSLPVGSVAQAPALVEDSSAAMRYGASAPIGARLDGLVNNDDVSVVLALPFTINFFGEDYGFVCISENGAMFPRKSVPDGQLLGVAFGDGAATCSNYDLPLGGLAIDAGAPALASLAADHWTAIATVPGCCGTPSIDGSKGVGDLLGTGGFTFPAVYAGATTVDGKDAYVVTWYRIPSHGTEAGAGEGTWTHQIVLIDDGKLAGAQTGNDFTAEFNYGTILTDRKGYSASDYGLGDGQRFAVGWASHRTATIASVAGRDVTLTSPHALDPAATFIIATDSDDNDRRVVLVNATTIRFDEDADLDDFIAGDTLSLSETYEFFADTSTSDLVDGAEKALTANRRNSEVDGRYTVSMVAGITVGFGTAQQAGDTLGGPTGPSTPVLTGGALPTVGAGQGVWRLEDGTSRPLTVSSPGTNQVRYSNDGIRVTFTGAPGTNVSRGLVADAAGEIDCEVCATLAAGGVIEAWMFSDPRLVAAHAVVDLPCQRFTIPLAAPLDGDGPITAGAHTLQLALPTASGMQAVNVGVTVGGPVPARVPAGEGPVVPGGLTVLGLLAAAGAAMAAGRWRTARS